MIRPVTLVDRIHDNEDAAANFAWAVYKFCEVMDYKLGEKEGEVLGQKTHRDLLNDPKIKDIPKYKAAVFAMARLASMVEQTPEEGPFAPVVAAWAEKNEAGLIAISEFDAVLQEALVQIISRKEKTPEDRELALGVANIKQYADSLGVNASLKAISGNLSLRDMFYD